MPSDGSESDGSDIKIQSALLKTSNTKIPNSPTDYILKKQQDKKLTTKIMIIEALVDLKSRKGVSLYAIKKYMTAKYNVDADRLNYYIKRYLKSAVEKGTIIQTKGVGASGSFKLVPVKEKKPKKKKTKKEISEKAKEPGKKAEKEKSKESIEKKLKPKAKSEESKVDKPVKAKKKVDAEKKPKEKKDGGEKEKKVRIAKKNVQTPLKKKGMMRRKSIGSIIKQPKMKPSAKA